MKNQKYLSVAITAVLCFTPMLNLRAQESSMRNDEVISLVKAGLSSSLIVSKIRSAKTNFDLSTNSMIELKKAGVSDEIVGAMLETKEGAFGYSDSQPAIKTMSGSRSGSEDKILSQMPEPGIYLSDNGKLTAIEPTIYSGTKGNFWGTALTYGIKKSKIRAVVRGKSANLQIKATRPEFYFLFSREYGNAGGVMSGIAGYSATSPAEFMMIAMNVKENSREATLGEFSAYTSSTGASDKDVREFTFEKIKPGLYKVTPKSDLPAGEYCFYYAGNGGTASKLFDFGVGH